MKKLMHGPSRTWKEASGRVTGPDGYMVGDITRSVPTKVSDLKHGVVDESMAAAKVLKGGVKAVGSIDLKSMEASIKTAKSKVVVGIDSVGELVNDSIDTVVDAVADTVLPANAGPSNPE